ncbi:hypothetical protein SANTM175S_07514 [Streptomyces antimycoticus]
MRDHPYNGMAAADLQGVVWQKSRHSNSQGSCVEFAKLPGGNVAVRNSRFPDGPALIYTPAEVEAMLLGAKDGEFDHLARDPAGVGLIAADARTLVGRAGGTRPCETAMSGSVRVGTAYSGFHCGCTGASRC